MSDWSCKVPPSTHTLTRPAGLLRSLPNPNRNSTSITGNVYSNEVKANIIAAQEANGGLTAPMSNSTCTPCSACLKPLHLASAISTSENARSFSSARINSSQNFWRKLKLRPRLVKYSHSRGLGTSRMLDILKGKCGHGILMRCQ